MAGVAKVLALTAFAGFIQVECFHHPRAASSIRPSSVKISPRFAARRARVVANGKPWDETPVPYASISIGVPKEVFEGEKRVSQTPTTVKALTDSGFRVVVETGAGAGASFSDEAYAAAGATVAATAAEAWSADMVLHINPPTAAEAASLGEGQALVSLVAPRQNEAMVADWAARGVAAVALDMVPRTLSRGQAFDVLSSQVISSVSQPPPKTPPSWMVVLLSLFEPSSQLTARILQSVP